jgi:hypothetical protein
LAPSKSQGTAELLPATAAAPCDNRAMSAGAQSQSSKSLSFVVIGLGAMGVAFAVGLSVFIFYMVRPRGEKVGIASLTDSGAVVVVQGSPGDSLVFRIDASIGVPRATLLSDDQVDQQASAKLRKSLLTVRAAAPSGAERTATCPVSNGRAASTTSTSGTFSRSGMLNDCVIVLDEPGAWKVRGAVAWASDLTLQSATLETRLDAVAN